MLNIKRLDIADANVLIAGARAKATEIGVQMCIAVTDESGNLIAFERMDGSKVTSDKLAIDKSYTASCFRKSTQELADVSQPGMPVSGINTTLGGRIVIFAGGIPVVSGSDVIGAIGVSSGTPAQDHEVAHAGLEAFANTQPSIL